MKSLVQRTSLVLLAAGAVSVGCQSHRERYVVDAFSAEARLLEDNIYSLQHRVERLERQVAQQRAADAGTRPPDSGARPAPRAPRRDEFPRPAPSPPGIDLDDDFDLTPPEIDPGSPADFGESGRRSAVAPAGQTAPLPARRAAGRISQSKSVLEVSGVKFDAFLLGSAPADGSRVGGLELLVLPINDRDEIVPVPGEITAVVLDATDGSHLGRWEYDAATARAALAAEGSEPGILLELRWREPLRYPELHVFVRLELSDGRRFESDRPFVVPRGEELPKDRPARGKTAAGPPASASPPTSSDTPPGSADSPSSTSRTAHPADRGPSAAVYR
jgi:hypothetical protein